MTATMTAAELTKHLQEILRTDIAAHLREVHGETNPPKTKVAQHKLHQKLHAEAAAQPASDAASAKDASVLSGVTRKPEESKPAPRKPNTTGRKTATTSTAKRTAVKAATKANDRKPPAKTAKPTPKPADKAKAN